MVAIIARIIIARQKFEEELANSVGRNLGNKSQAPIEVAEES